MGKRYLEALTTNYIFSDQVSFIPEGAGGVGKQKGRTRIVAVAGAVITCSEDQVATFLDRNKRGSKKWEDVTDLVNLDADSPHKVFADPPNPALEGHTTEEPEPQASDALVEFAGEKLAEDLHDAGFVGIHEIANADLAQLTAIKGIGDATANQLKGDAAKLVSGLEKGDSEGS